jgi:hypothetical protein
VCVRFGFNFILFILYFIKQIIQTMENLKLYKTNTDLGK